MKNLLPIIQQLAKRGARPLTVTLRTVPKLSKKCPYQGIEKLSVVNCFLNFNYGRSVNRQRAREEKATTFKTQESWFDHTETPSVVVGKKSGRQHLQLKVERILSVIYRDAEGKEYTSADLQEYLPEIYDPTKQGLNKPVLTMVPAFDSIVALTADGEKYE